MIYAETLCGVAQIVRDPKMPKDTPLSYREVYYGLPSPYGAFTAQQPFQKLTKPSEDELRWIPLAEELHME